MPCSGEDRLNHPPCIAPEHMPDEIMTAYFDEENDYEAMVIHLQAYAKSGSGWEEYRKKITSKLLDKWGKVLRECRQNGFVGPYVEAGEIRFRQLVDARKNPPVRYDRCSFCERICKLRDHRGALPINVNPCWAR